jgi:hypothetical protein
MRFSFLPTLFIASMVVVSCNQGGKGSKASGPIVLGDPATIVTETDSQYLQNMVLDIQMNAKPSEPEPAAATDGETPAIPDSAIVNEQLRKKEEAQQKEQPKEEVKEEPKKEAPKGKGLTMDLKEIEVFIPNIAGKGKNTSYQLTSGSLNGNTLKITGGTIQKVSQRYQTVVVATSSQGTLVLDNLSTTTGWQTMKGSGGNYAITGLADNRLQAPKASAQAIRSAVEKAARKRKYSKAGINKWAAAVRNVRSVNQKPLDVKLRTVMWKIDGKDSKGKAFSKQLRIDLPI